MRGRSFARGHTRHAKIFALGEHLEQPRHMQLAALAAQSQFEGSRAMAATHSFFYKSNSHSNGFRFTSGFCLPTQLKPGQAKNPAMAVGWSVFVWAGWASNHSLASGQPYVLPRLELRLLVSIRMHKCDSAAIDVHKHLTQQCPTQSNLPPKPKTHFR